MKILVDGHCDTLSKALDEKSNLENQAYCFNIVDANNKTPCIQTVSYTHLTLPTILRV